MSQVSVIIPTHNRAESLRAAIESVLQQTFQDFEIFVIDDASTDHTYDLVCSFKENRIHYSHLDGHNGDAATRNAGLKQARGQYVAFLDDDDVWFPEKLKRQVEVFEQSPPEICGVYTSALNFDVVENKIVSIKQAHKRGNLFQDVLTGNRLTTSSVMLRRACLDQVGLFDESLPVNSDQDLWIRLSKVFQWECIETPLVKYALNPRGLTKNFKIQIKGKILVLKKYEQWFVRYPMGHSEQYLHLGTLHCLAGDTQEGRAAYRRSMKIAPWRIKPYLVFGVSLFGLRAFNKVLTLWRRGGRRLASECRPYVSFQNKWDK
jgi:glycosyltransferase involved in cell wall biosynthesis